jgi:uncharacterized protein
VTDAAPGDLTRTDRTLPSWGLGDVAIGILAAQVLSIVAVLIAYSAAGWKSSDDVPMWAGAVLQVPLWAGYLGAVWLAGRNKGDGLVRDFGLRFRPLDVPLGLVIGVGMQLIVLPLIYLPLLRLLDQTSDDLSRPARELADKAQGTVGWIVLALIVVVGAPVVEELFFRGLLLRSLQKRGLGDVWSCVVCAAVFAAMHLQPLQFVGLFAIGLVLSVLAVRTGRLGPSICTHAAFNATSVVLLYRG